MTGVCGADACMIFSRCSSALSAIGYIAKNIAAGQSPGCVFIQHFLPVRTVSLFVLPDHSCQAVPAISVIRFDIESPRNPLCPYHIHESLRVRISERLQDLLQLRR